MRIGTNTGRRVYYRAMALVVSMSIISAASTQLRADTGMCGTGTSTLPFIDVMGNPFFCQIAEAYYSGLTNGTTATTFSPGANVPREQMAAFITRAMDQSVKRSSPRAALDQFWNIKVIKTLALTTVGDEPDFAKADGSNIWVANYQDWTVSRVRAYDGKLLDTWDAAYFASGVLCAMGSVFVAGSSAPGRIYKIDPTLPVGNVNELSDDLGIGPHGIAFDGQRIWTSNSGGGETSVSIITFNPLVVTNVSTDFSFLNGIIYDGANIWVTDNAGVAGKLRKLNSDGSIAQSVDVGGNPKYPAFDGTNIWVPNADSNTISVVRASTGVVIATLSGNGLNGPNQAAFDGERILVTNQTGHSVSLWKASDLTVIDTVPTGTNSQPTGVCSDGINFWITFTGTDKLARF